MVICRYDDLREFVVDIGKDMQLHERRRHDVDEDKANLPDDAVGSASDPELEEAAAEKFTFKPKTSKTFKHERADDDIDVDRAREKERNAKSEAESFEKAAAKQQEYDKTQKRFVLAVLELYRQSSDKSQQKIWANLPQIAEIIQFYLSPT